MPDAVLTREAILEAAEDVLRRYGPSKANVVDVARALGVSHGSVYRHFPSKAALVDAVVEHWLADVAEPLAAVATEPAPAADRLGRWLDLLVATKQRRAREDPELFATYVALTAEARGVVGAHVETLIGQLAGILADGVSDGSLAAADASATARAVFDATARFHNPVNAGSWGRQEIDTEYTAVRALVSAALARPAQRIETRGGRS
jgi:AcrR family transcriptional regulator